MRWLIWTVCTAGLSVTGVHAAEDKTPFTGQSVRIIRDIAYHNGSTSDPIKHKLDLYLPAEQTDFPVYFFVHGGAWRMGDKSWYGKMGRMLAEQGIGCVITNYRLSPKVKHPAHIEDVAEAFAWTYKHIQDYGGSAKQIFLAGHSAGAHLVSLLATDESYLQAHQLGFDALKGVIAMSGVYTVLPTVMYQSVFGRDERTRKRAFPITHVHGDHPPFLILYAEADFPLIDLMSETFSKKLKQTQCPVEQLEIKNRDHISLMANAFKASDVTTQTILRFMKARLGVMK